MSTRRVTATLPRLAGSGRWVDFKLSMVSAQISPGEIFTTDFVRIHIDSQGRVGGATGVELWCNVDGVFPAHWTVKFPDGSIKGFDLPAGPDPVDLAELLAIGTTTEWSPAAYAVIDAHIAVHAGLIASPTQLGHVKVPADNISVDGTLIFPVVSSEVVQDALAAFFPDNGAYDWTYDDAGNRVGLVIAPATSSVNGLMSAADKTVLDGLPGVYATLSDLTTEASARSSADSAIAATRVMAF